MVTATSTVEDHSGETSGFGLRTESGTENGGTGDGRTELLAAEILRGSGSGHEGHTTIVVDRLGVEVEVGQLEREARAGGGALHRLADAPAALLHEQVLLGNIHEGEWRAG